MTSIPTILKFIEDSKFQGEEQTIYNPMRAKKRRLDHLSWEEKIQRKKLKNRVAAQTSRDRKKAKMDQMEGALQELFAKNEALMAECEALRAANQELREAGCANCRQNRSVECEAVNGPAESHLLPQGLATTHSAATLATIHHQHKKPLLKMLLAFLLYRTCLTNSTPTSTFIPLNNSRKVSCRISPETWRMLLKRQMLKNQVLVQKWWGRHQNTWNPIEIR